MASGDVVIVLNLKDLASQPADKIKKHLTGALDKSSKSAKNTSKNLAKTDKQVKKISKSTASLTKNVIKLIGAYVGLQAVKKTAATFATFEENMRNVNAILQLNEEEFENLTDSVLEMATRTGKAPADLAAGLYDIASAGNDAAAGLDVLEASANAATAGVSDTKTAASAITDVLNAYGKSADQAADVSDILFQIVKDGKINFAQLSEGLGMVLSTATGANISFQELGAAIAAMTSLSVKPAQAFTSLNRFIDVFAKNKAPAFIEALKSTDFATGEALIKAKGLSGALEFLDKNAGRSTAALGKLGFAEEAAKAAMVLLTNDTEKFTAGLKNMEEKSGATMDALNQQTKAASFGWKQFMVEVDRAMIEIGRALSGEFKELTLWLKESVTDLARWIKENKELILTIIKVGSQVAKVLIVLKTMQLLNIKIAKTQKMRTAGLIAWGFVVFEATRAIKAYIQEDSKWLAHNKRLNESTAKRRASLEEARNEHHAQIQKSRADRFAELSDEEKIADVRREIASREKNNMKDVDQWRKKLSKLLKKRVQAEMKILKKAESERQKRSADRMKGLFDEITERIKLGKDTAEKLVDNEKKLATDRKKIREDLAKTTENIERKASDNINNIQEDVLEKQRELMDRERQAILEHEEAKAKIKSDAEKKRGAILGSLNERQAGRAQTGAARAAKIEEALQQRLSRITDQGDRDRLIASVRRAQRRVLGRGRAGVAARGLFDVSQAESEAQQAADIKLKKKQEEINNENLMLRNQANHRISLEQETQARLTAEAEKGAQERADKAIAEAQRAADAIRAINAAGFGITPTGANVTEGGEFAPPGAVTPVPGGGVSVEDQRALAASSAALRARNAGMSPASAAIPATAAAQVGGATVAAAVGGVGGIGIGAVVDQLTQLNEEVARNRSNIYTPQGQQNLQSGSVAITGS